MNGETLTQRALLQIHQVLFDMLDTGRTDEYRVAKLALQEAVMRDPAQSNLGHGEVVLVGDGLDLRESSEEGFLPVPVQRGPSDQAGRVLRKNSPPAIVLSLHLVRVKAASNLDLVVQRMVATREESAAH
ncbi:hypothetical protein EVG20_g10843 [Dentipellis fragilis]|uniref:Uncharacterized protein n=1 Tax=Dentipellis fragilis TaxID=205917 RepID=A0A4Y9XNT9_9AGAM|nr:hypothetical protein EVG20_g10843 [Dentipellis fragilis]